MWDVPTSKKLVALTFDDGPHPGFTPEILDVLKKYNAKATFFVVGNRAERYPGVLKREVSEGHEIGNHTYSHTRLNHLSNPKAWQNEIEKTDTLIQNFQGAHLKLLRPPEGILSEAIINVAVKKHYEIILWS
ncbi:polysaccharide deacetylase family protein [Camelliibacillus cellulosilyticus]|uniref:Polysaccharide deacetylase family protein n=1 Tax=Camelliibacillus cellulosilyticus TaxID=2174486 RepID=A0ABV9GK89_9BACL